MSATETSYGERLLGGVLVLGVGANELFHAVFDGMDWAANVEIVSLVLSMSATSDPDSWRSVHSSFAATMAYGGIWLAHAVSGVIAAVGAFLLVRLDWVEATLKHRAYSVAIIGVGIGALLYLVGFVTIASGWFILHTSPTPPNFVPNAERLFLCYMAVIVYLGVFRRP